MVFGTAPVVQDAIAAAVHDRRSGYLTPTMTGDAGALAGGARIRWPGLSAAERSSRA